jgi:hypothetical protein
VRSREERALKERLDRAEANRIAKEKLLKEEVNKNFRDSKGSFSVSKQLNQNSHLDVRLAADKGYVYGNGPSHH